MKAFLLLVLAVFACLAGAHAEYATNFASRPAMQTAGGSILPSSTLREGILAAGLSDVDRLEVDSLLQGITVLSHLLKHSNRGPSTRNFSSLDLAADLEKTCDEAIGSS